MNRKSYTIFAAALAVSASHAEPVNAQISLTPIGTYETGVFDEGAAEIVAYDADTERLFVTNADANTIDILDISDPTNPTKLDDIDLSPYGGGVNSVAVRDGVVAAAVEASPKQNPGKVVFFDTEGGFLSSVTVGALPDMLTFTPDGTKILVANEGEPSDDYLTDPEGSVSIIDVSGGVPILTQSNVSTASFAPFNKKINKLRRGNVRIFGPGASVSQDVEPEYIAVSADSSTAYVVLQENNAIASVDIASATVIALKGMGYKNHRSPKNALDASNKDNAINIQTWPVKGMYQPDAIATYEVNGKTYLVTANEGDSRDYDGFSEEKRVKELTLGNGLLKPNAFLQEDDQLGRLKITTAPPAGKRSHKSDHVYTQLFSYGARSFSVWDSEGSLLFDSGDDFEQIVSIEIPDFFNANNDDNEFDNRSDDKGPEPEGLTLGEIGGRTYAFIGLERVGGIMVYDVTDPVSPTFVEYVNNRDFTEDPETGSPKDLGPEGLLFIPGTASPSEQPLLVVANEVSGTTTIYAISDGI